MIENTASLADRLYARSIAVRYWEQGRTLQSIATQDHSSRQTVSAVMKRWHIPVRSGRDARPAASALIVGAGDLV